MTQSLTTTDLKELLGYPFKDANWKNKFLIGSLVVFAGFAIPVVPFLALYGYMLQIMRRIIVDEGEPHLPEWDDWGNLLTDGLKLLGAIFVFMLPVFLVLAVGYAFFFASLIATGVVAGTVERGDEAAGAMVGVVPLAGGLVILLTYAMALLLALAMGMVLPVIMGHVVATNNFSAAFRWREWWPIFRVNLSGFLMADLVVLALSFGLSSVLSLLYLTIILCCLAPLIMAPVTMYLSAIHSVLFAQAYREGVQKLKNQGI
ncbi:MAG: DUF4013 domain-containing protein [Chloroflexi bacterium]|nr:DUF4013 domain-containing protein [Chloroflexota bacterium]